VTEDEPLKADIYIFEPLPDDPDKCENLWRDMVRRLASNGSVWARFTVWDDTRNSDIYPNGFYAEGWLERPKSPASFEDSFPLEEVK